MTSRNGSIARTAPLFLVPEDLRPSDGRHALTSPLSSTALPRASSISAMPNEKHIEGMHSGLDDSTFRRSGSTDTTKVDSGHGTMSRAGTLRKKDSLRQRSLEAVAAANVGGSRRNLQMGNVRGTDEIGEDVDYNSVFFTPVPTTGNPTEVLANRFQSWRKLLKELIAYFREVQASYESRSKVLMKVSNVVHNTAIPSAFMTEGGIDDATGILRTYHKQAQTEAQKARDIENEVIAQLSGLRQDLQQKTKEINKLSGDFKNSADKEKEGTRKLVNTLQEALSTVETNATAGGKGDPLIIRLAVDRQVGRQLEEENYLHRAYLNLEGSGRELESIVVGEIQKAYSALANILRREADAATETVELLRNGPIALPKDYEWDRFILNDPHFVNPDLPLRVLEKVQYPGQHNPQASEIRSGMLERKSKYLKSYTSGWYVLSATHLHEFKSPDNISAQTPVMSLYLLDQKLGSHSQPDAGSNKFSLKGKQTGAMHRGHSWVFRADKHATMLAWYEDIRNLTEKTAAERLAFVKRNARSTSLMKQQASSLNSDALDDDETDEIPYGSTAAASAPMDLLPQRSTAGGQLQRDFDTSRSRGMLATASREPSLRNVASGVVAVHHPVAYQGDISRATSTGNLSSRPVTPLQVDSDQSRLPMQLDPQVPAVVRSERYNNVRYNNERYKNERYNNERYNNKRYNDQQNNNERYNDERYNNERYNNERHSNECDNNERYLDEQIKTERHNNERSHNEQHGNERHKQERYNNERYNNELYIDQQSMPEHRSVSDPVRRTPSAQRIQQPTQVFHELPSNRTPPFQQTSYSVNGAPYSNTPYSNNAGSPTPRRAVTRSHSPRPQAMQAALSQPTGGSAVQSPVVPGPTVVGQDRGTYAGEPSFSTAGAPITISKHGVGANGGAGAGAEGTLPPQMLETMRSSSLTRSVSDYGDGDARHTRGTSKAASSVGRESEVKTTAPSEAGLERERDRERDGRAGVRPTGHLFPSVVRHDTDMTVTQLHVPGEFGAA